MDRMAVSPEPPERTAVIASPIDRSSREVPRSIARLQHALRKQDGFTVIEMLVVVLIIGILAAIAIPSFLGQTARANDAAAKTQVGTLQTAMREFAMENSGSYKGATLAKLEALEPTLRDETTAVAKEVAGATTTNFEVESEATGSKDVYKLTSINGGVTRSCTPVNAGGCKGGTW
jgi:type IV pilus assembly protein PilA